MTNLQAIRGEIKKLSFNKIEVIKLKTTKEIKLG
jgi:hypothetical protein